MVRKLKYHERKLLKKFDFINWKCDNNLHELKIMKRFYIQDRQDYTVYNQLSRQIRTIAEKLKDVDENDPFREEMTRLLLSKLHNIGIISAKSTLMLASRVNASSFCKRRLPIVMKRYHMAETLQAAVTFIEQGHVRVGVDTIRDPAFLVTRAMEDYVTWSNASKIKRSAKEYNGILDDYDD